MKEELLKIQNLTAIYKTDLETVHAVNDISLTLKRGETLGLVGETGAGKTTTALALLRLLPERIGKITEGTIEFDGKNIYEIPESEMCAIRGRRISMIFQNPMTSLDPLQTVGDQIAEAVLLHESNYGQERREKNVFEKNHTTTAREAADKRVDEVLRLVGIPPERKKEYPHQFSGGMKQRVVIAIALACEPELLIADEPTTALDVTIQAQVLTMIDDLRKKLNTSMIMITHDLGVVAQTCDKVAVMYAGEIIESGRLEDVFEAEKNHPYTKGLFGSIPNIEEKTDRLSPISGLMPDPTDLPVGCAFSPRCPNCMEICRQKKPDYFTNGEHKIKCFFLQEQETQRQEGSKI